MIKVTFPDTVDHVYANSDYLFYSTYVEHEVIFGGKNIERTVFCISGKFIFDGKQLHPGDSVELRNIDLIFHGSGRLYVAQVVTKDATDPFIKITRRGNHYKVTKPWGHELWINGQHPLYSVKKILIKAGNKTSLQYHNFKEETNLIEDGDVCLVYKRNLETPLDEVKSTDLGEHDMSGPVCLHVTPRTIHRLVAKTDLHLFEVSTAYLDDVVRIQDDHQRPNGRIDSEHA